MNDSGGVRQHMITNVQRHRRHAVRAVFAPRARRSALTAAALGLVGTSLAITNSAAHAAAPANAASFIAQFGTSGGDQVVHSARAPGGLYVVGNTAGSLSPTPGNEYQGGTDVFVARLDASGNPVWVRQLGTVDDETVGGLSIASNGDLVVAGSTRGSLSATNRGFNDVFVARFSANGTRRWVRQIGTPADDLGNDIAAAPNGALYIAGATEGTLGRPTLGGRDAFLGRLETNGRVRWIRQFGSKAKDSLDAVAVNGDSIPYVVGTTEGAVRFPWESVSGTSDLFVSRLTQAGGFTWLRQIGSEGDEAAVDLRISPSNGPVILANTTGSLAAPNAGGEDVYVRALNSRGIGRMQAQFGTPEQDRAHGFTVTPDGDVFVAGSTFGTMNEPNAGGGGDAFVTRLDSTGDRKWTHQFGTDTMDEATSVTTLADGTLAVSGYTNGIISFSGSQGGVDSFVAMLPATRNPVWSHQFGSAVDDSANSVSVSTGGLVYVGGTIDGQAVVSQYSATGNRRWSRAFGGAAPDAAHGVAALPNGGVVVVGRTENWLPRPLGFRGDTSLGAGDAFVALYSFQGQLRWIRQFGTGAEDTALAVAVGPRNEIYVGGSTAGTLSTSPEEANPNDRGDAFIARFDLTGKRLWLHQFGSGEEDAISSLSVAANGVLFVGGNTFGTVSPIPEEVSRDGFDVFIARYRSDGARQWIHQFGTESNDFILGVAANPAGGVSVAGSTGESLAAPIAGGGDAFIGHFADDGTVAWLQQFGTLYNDSANAVTALPNGEIVAVGYTDGDLFGPTSGFTDAFVVRLPHDGSTPAGVQFGRIDNDSFLAVASRGSRVFAVGTTTGSLNEPNRATLATPGTTDALIARVFLPSLSPI